jgi:hypothetical protein
MLAAGFEPATPATERPQTYALDLAATGIGHAIFIEGVNMKESVLVYTQCYIWKCLRKRCQ